MIRFRPGARIIIAFLIVVSLGISVGLYATVQRPQRAERILFFPGTVEPDLSGEARLIPRRDELEGRVALLVEELTYGPARIDRSRVVPRQTRPESVMVRNGTAYIDLSTQVLAEDTSVILSLEESLNAIEHTVRYNFRQLDRIVITIGGEILREQHPQS